MEQNPIPYQNRKPLAEWPTNALEESIVCSTSKQNYNATTLMRSYRQHYYLSKKEKYIDELRFTRSFIKDKIRFNKWGKQR